VYWIEPDPIIDVAVTACEAICAELPIALLRLPLAKADSDVTVNKPTIAAWRTRFLFFTLVFLMLMVIT